MNIFKYKLSSEKTRTSVYGIFKLFHLKKVWQRSISVLWRFYHAFLFYILYIFSEISLTVQNVFFF